MMSRFAMIAMTALLLGSAAMPAQAQIPGFGVYFGDEESDFFPERITCMTDRQIRDDIAARGFTDVALNVPNDKHVEVRATRDGIVYLLDFNFCSGRIVKVTELRPAS
jgi:hypothetical protein